MNGDITVWRLSGRTSNSKEHSKPHFLGRYSTHLGRIIRMHWHYTKEHGKQILIFLEMEMGIKAFALIFCIISLFFIFCLFKVNKICILVGGGLSFGDTEGRMSIINIKCLDKEVAYMDNELAFWTEPDNVAVDKITVMIYDNFTYIILVKKSFLIIYGLNESGEVFNQKVCNVGCYYITGMSVFQQELIIRSTEKKN